MRLLIAEDELDLAEALTVFFEKNHFSVDAVNDGFSAYEYGVSGEYDAIILGQYRIIIVVRPRRQIFRQIVQKFRRHTNVCQEISVQDDGKCASKRAAKAAAVNCAVLP